MILFDKLSDYLGSKCMTRFVYNVKLGNLSYIEQNKYQVV